jgi:hypothetical protein
VLETAKCDSESESVDEVDKVMTENHDDKNDKKVDVRRVNDKRSDKKSYVKIEHDNPYSESDRKIYDRRESDKESDKKLYADREHDNLDDSASNKKFYVEDGGEDDKQEDNPEEKTEDNMAVRSVRKSSLDKKRSRRFTVKGGGGQLLKINARKTKL